MYTFLRRPAREPVPTRRRVAAWPVAGGAAGEDCQHEQGGRSARGSEGSKGPPRRQYPPLYEKIVPIALGVVVAAVIILLFVIATVFLGLFPGSG